MVLIAVRMNDCKATGGSEGGREGRSVTVVANLDCGIITAMTMIDPNPKYLSRHELSHPELSHPLVYSICF